MDHDLRGVAFRVTGMRAEIRGARMANGVELLRACTFAELRELRDVDVPGLGVVLDVGAPRVNPLPTAAQG